MEDIIAKRKFLALIEEVEVDENGNILVAAEEVATEPVQEEVVEAVEEPVQIAVVEAVQEEAVEEPADLPGGGHSRCPRGGREYGHPPR